MDTAAARAHRRGEAERGFPLLRGCPSTCALRRIAVLDSLPQAERLEYADQLSVLAETAAAARLTEADRGLLIARLPVVARVEAMGPGRPELRFQGVKSLARLAREPGGIGAFARLQGLTGAAAGPPVPHVGSFDAAVPVAPGRLRKAMLGAVQARFGGAARTVSADLEQVVAEVPGGRMVLNLRFGGRVWGAMSRQMDHSLWADLRGVRLEPTSYEALWLVPAQWDLLTLANVASAAGHLVRVLEARLALA